MTISADGEQRVKDLQRNTKITQIAERRAERRHYDKLQHRIDQAYTDRLDGKIPEDLFLRKMNEWREEQSKILSQIRGHQTANHNYLEEGIRLVELANKAYFLYVRQPAHEKARLLKIVQSNCTWDGVNPCPKYRKPFDILAEGLSPANWLPVLADLQTIAVSFSLVA
jgi:site-specific DNA recombinase